MTAARRLVAVTEMAAPDLATEAMIRRSSDDQVELAAQRAQELATRAAILAKHQAEFAARAQQNRERLRTLAQLIVPPLLGIGLMLAVWSWLAQLRPDLPGPISTWDAAVVLFSDPFYDNGPNDQGIGWNILHSLARV